jgi:hypothetical protein
MAPEQGSVTLTHLLDRAGADGLDPLMVRALIEEAADLGASRALARLGLQDASAGSDLKDLRALLEAWRDMKRSVWRAVAGWAAKLLLALLLAGLAVKMKWVGTG